VLMDYKMPEMDGIETSQRIQKHKGIVQPKIIMITSFAREEIRNRAEQASLDGFLSKPVSSSTLFDSIFTGVFGVTENSMINESDSTELGEDFYSKIQGARILLVEDNEVNQQVAIELLEYGKLVVDVANNGQEAVDILKTKEFDAVLMDIQMPVMDGYTASKAIRGELELTELPIIAMTANAMAGDREKCLDAGMNDHVAKPIDPKEMFSSLARWIRYEQREIPQELLERLDSKEKSPQEIPDMPGFDAEMAVKRVGGNVKSYLNTLSKVLDSEADFEARMSMHLSNEDYEAAERDAHTLKGVSGNIGAPDLQTIAGELESAIEHRTLDKLDDLVKDAVSLLTVKLAVIQNVLDESKPKSKGSFDTAKVQELLEKLAVEIDNFAATSEESSDALRDQLRGSEFEGAIEKIHSALQKYDFDSAESGLNELKSALQGAFDQSAEQESNNEGSSDDWVASEELKAALSELAERIENYDSTAEEAVIDLLEAYPGIPLQDGLKALKKTLANYDFDQAEVLLTDLMNQTK